MRKILFSTLILGLLIGLYIVRSGGGYDQSVSSMDDSSIEASVQVNSPPETDPSDSQDSRFERLPVTALYRHMPSVHANMFNTCGISETFPSQLQIAVDDLATKKYNDDFSSVIAALRSDELGNNPDAQAVLGFLYEQHLVPEVALTFESDEIAFSLYESSANSGSDIGEYYLALAYYYGYPHSRWVESLESEDRRQLQELISDANWNQSTGFLLKNLYAVSLLQDSIDGVPNRDNSLENVESVFKESAETCSYAVTSINYAQFLIEKYGLQSEKGREGLSIIEGFEHPAAYETLGQLYYDGRQSNSYYTNSFVDKDKALENYLKAAAFGDPDAAYEAFEMLFFDEDVRKDSLLAIDMLELSARLGDYGAVSYTAFFLLADDAEVYEKNVSRAVHYQRQLFQFWESGEVPTNFLIRDTRDFLNLILLEEELDTETFDQVIEINLSELKPHLDRKSCDISGTLCIGYDVSNLDNKNSNWPMYIRDDKGNQKPIHLNLGDVVLYKGAEIAHWREPFEGKNHAQVFLHYNKDTKENQIFRNDGRPCFGLGGDFRSEEFKGVSQYT